ncbi:MAG: PD-(D/E)XK nuclease family protein [Curtobacterium sp.]
MSNGGGRRADALATSAWDGRTLVIEDPDALQRIRRKEISPSVVGAIHKCPASFAASNVLPQPSDPFQPRLIGTGAHEAMEHLFQQAPENRVPDFVHAEVDRIRDDLWAAALLVEPDRRALLLPDAPADFLVGTEVTDELVAANAAAAKRWDDIVRPWTQGIFTMSSQPHPREINVFATELAVGGWNYEEKRPNDVTLSLMGARGPFPVQGKIDRTDVVVLGDGELGLAVEDYKFPQKKPRALKQDSDYADQQRAYRLFIEGLHPGMKVAGASLLYPGYDKNAIVDISEPMMTRTLLKFESAWLQMNASADSGRFATKPSNLCGWCDLANTCPVAKVTTEKAAASAATKPAAYELGISVATPHASPSAWAEKSGYLALPVRVPITNGGTAPDPVRAVHREEHNTNDLGGDTPMNQPAPALVAKYPTSEYAAINAFGVTDAAVDLLVRQGIDLTPSTIGKMSALLASIVEEVSRGLFGDSFDWGHGRTSRICFALRESVKVRPAPFNIGLVDEHGNTTGSRPGSRAEWDLWHDRVLGLTKAKAIVALDIVSRSSVGGAEALAFFAGPGEQPTPQFQSVAAVA